VNRTVRSLQTIADLLERVARWLATGFMLLMLLCILLQIVARYLFDQPPAWTEELARHAMIWAGFLGATVACRRRLDPVLVSSAKIALPGLRQAARWLEALAIAIFAIPILLAAPHFLELHAERYTDSLQLPSVLVVVIIPLCIAVILFHAVARVLIESAHGQPQKDLE
jgi:TRAP-type C4-dicarboxylate transport system permease small subunit